MVKQDKPGKFVYRDAVWHGSDMLGTGVASFSHMSGVHFQNAASWDDYINSLHKNQLPLDRAFPNHPGGTPDTRDDTAIKAGQR